MELIKRQASNNFNDYHDNKRQKIQNITDETHGLPTCFEDLSNELIYEIFEFIDHFYVYEVFYHLNTRFRRLLIHSDVPLKISFSFLTKSSFTRYNKDIIVPNVDRISSLYFSDAFSYEFILISMPKLSEFSRLETLILYNIESECLLLDQLSFLSLLSTLIVTTVDRIINQNTLLQIFRLPALKYCKLSFNPCSKKILLPVATNQYSSIEHLIITSNIYLEDLHSLLSYVPHLRRLSLGSLFIFQKLDTYVFPQVLKHLTHVFVTVKYMPFYQFKQLVINTFRTTQIFRFTLEYITDHTYMYMNANEWKELIVFHLSNLRVFDIQLDFYPRNDIEQLRIETAINQFTAPFLFERQWFFTHRFYQRGHVNRSIFHSTNPYRRKYYILSEQFNENTSLYHYESNFDSVQHVQIQSEESLINCKNSFPNVTELTIDYKASHTNERINSILNHIIPLIQLTKLAVGWNCFPIQAIIKLLYYSPNIHTLELKSIPCLETHTNYTSIKQSEDFQLVSKTNVIRYLSYGATCTLDKIDLLVALCPRMQHLSIDTLARDLKSVTRSLLDKTKQSTNQLSSLCFSRAENNYFEEIDALIKTETLLVDSYILKMIGWRLYLWW